MEDNFSNEVTTSVNNSLKIILNQDKSSSLLVVSKILVSIGNVYYHLFFLLSITSYIQSTI